MLESKKKKKNIRKSLKYCINIMLLLATRKPMTSPDSQCRGRGRKGAREQGVNGRNLFKREQTLSLLSKREQREKEREFPCLTGLFIRIKKYVFNKKHWSKLVL